MVAGEIETDTGDTNPTAANPDSQVVVTTGGGELTGFGAGVRIVRSLPVGIDVTQPPGTGMDERGVAELEPVSPRVWIQ
jgi:hypothetical protein